MWSAIRWLVLRIAAVRWLFKLGWLGLFLPFAFLLKLIGIPLMAVLSIVALPVLLLLFLFGLPILLVMAAGGLVMGLIGLAITLGIAALKFAIFVVLPIWLVAVLVQTVWRCVRRSRGDDGSCGPPTSPKGAPTPPPEPPPATASASFDGA